jgi:uncharacterized protein YprB with RNaseH-like and TPR domain
VRGVEGPARDSVAGLREKLARLGGLVSPAALQRDHPRPWREPQPAPRQPGFEPEENAAGVAWVRRVDVDLHPLLDAAGACAPAGAAALASLVHGAAEPAADEPLAVLDIESLGLRGSGVLAFLVGVGLQRGAHLEVHQLLLQDPGEEEALLTALLDRLESCAAMVTYNGRTFDIPTLRARCIVNRLDEQRLDARPHVDLLGPVRRLFRERLGSCTLRQAELDLLNMERVDDVPGFEAPARYHAWLRGAAPDVLTGVVRHNQLDLCATAVLGARLVEHVEGEMVQPVHAADRYRLAIHLDRRGAHQRAEHLLRQAVAARAAPWDRRAAHRLALRLRRAGPAGREEALGIWRSLWRGDPGDLRGARSLAVALERCGHLDEALEVSRSALRLCAAMPAWRQAALRGAPRGGWHADWERRADRLTVRIARAGAPRRTAAQRTAAQLTLRTA